MSLSEKLRNLRDNRGWSQQYLADRMNVDRSTISRYETGKSLPSYQMVIRFAEVYQVEKELLLLELDPNVPITDKPGYILKENLDDRDLEIVLELIGLEPDLKRILLDIHAMESKRRAYFIEVIMAELRVLKKHKRV